VYSHDLRLDLGNKLLDHLPRILITAKEVGMRTIGIDLAIKRAHKAIVADEQGRYVTPIIQFHTRAAELDQLLARAREGAQDPCLQIVMEPTGMAWFPIAAYLARQDNVTLYLVNSQQVAALRRFYKRHAKSDRIDARVLALLPRVNPDHLHRLAMPSATAFACQQGCKELDRLSASITAIKNRLHALDRFAWPGLDEIVFPDIFAPAARWFHQHWYDPVDVIQAGAESIRQQWLASGVDEEDAGLWADSLFEIAYQVVALYGDDGRFLDFKRLQAEVCREQDHLSALEAVHHRLRLKTVRPLYRQIHPSRRLETLKGVGQDGAAVYASFIGDPHRFNTNRLFRGWHGLIPDSRQSADSEAKGLHVSQAGPNLIKKYAYLNADVGRQWDPQLAAIYFDQMVHKGKHHNQAVCACATHLLDRVLAVLREDKAYELRDVDGTPVTVHQARAIIAERYTVPDEVRERNNKRARRERAERKAEKKHQRESRPR
jgi:transposase